MCCCKADKTESNWLSATILGFGKHLNAGLSNAAGLHVNKPARS